MMRNFRFAPLLVLAVCLCCLSPVFAVEGDSGSADIADSASDPGFVIVDSVPESPELEDSSVEDTSVEQSPADQPEEEEEESVNDTEAFVPDAPIPIQIVQADTPDDSEEAAASSVYVQIKDWPGGSSDSDSSSDSDVTYILEPDKFPESFIEWSVSDGIFTVVVKDEFFASVLPDVDKESALLMLSQYEYQLTVDDVPVDGFSVDWELCSFTFPYSGDGRYLVSSVDDSVPLYCAFYVTADAGAPFGSSLGSAVLGLLGSYTPETYTVTTYLPDGSAVTSTEIVPGLAGLDYEWIAGAVLFTLALYCIFRMIGGIFRWN